jgi:hypothetical protein
MPKTTTDLKDIVRLGGGLSIDATKLTTTDLKDIARLANTSGVTLVIRNADTKTSTDLKDISRLAPGKVIFEI